MEEDYFAIPAVERRETLVDLIAVIYALPGGCGKQRRPRCI
jgi:hypothetical protein